ncbi:TolC family protein [Variovorax sp. VNK109]|uniref:TolC family protein n=1 Tax=Variovorax sp. VNK109 TaxID=3400919 RepID=UPI003C0B2205
MFHSFTAIPRWLLAASFSLLAGCASVSPDGLRGDVAQLAAGRLGGDAPAAAPVLPVVDAGASPVSATIDTLLAQPLTSDAAVRIALLRNPSLESSLAALGVSDADRVQAGRLPNPHLSLGRFTEGSTREIERMISFDVLGLVTLPWRAQWQGQQTELAKLSAAQDVVRLAADTRRAWVRAVAAQESAAQMRLAFEAAEAGTLLARRMQGAGNFSRLQLAREEALLADASAQMSKSRLAAARAREQLSRLMGLEASQTGYTLPANLPALPPLQEPQDAEARALRERLDVRAAREESRYVADSLGYTRATGFIDALELGYGRNTTWDSATGAKETKRGWEIGVPLPIFDWGTARSARAQAIYMQSVAKVRDVALRARSEARESVLIWRTAHELARRSQEEGVAVQQVIQEETLLRYNGMLSSVWQLLAEARATSLAVSRAIEARRDFWLADTDLRQVMNGTSPASLSGLGATSGSAATTASGGH